MSVCDCVLYSVCVFVCLCLYEHLFVEHRKVFVCVFVQCADLFGEHNGET